MAFERIQQWWWRGAGGGARAGSALARRLASYPPYDAPHVGHGRQLTLEQAHENFACFVAVKPRRLDAVGALLRETAAIDIAPALAAPRSQAPALTDALDDWARREWPALRTPALADYRRWHTTRRAGDDIVYSLLFDVAIVFGELIAGANAAWRWGLDLDADNLRDDMASARRIVLLADPLGAATRPFVVDVEGIVVGRFQQPQDLHFGVGADRSPLRSLNPWQRMVAEAIRGDAFAAWR